MLHKMSIRLLAVLLILIHHTRGQSCVADKKYPSCMCQNLDGKEINLRSIGSTKSSEPRFKRITGGDHKYSYNPCYPFTAEGDCKDVALCQYIDATTSNSLGTQETAAFLTEGADLKITYNGGTEFRMSEVTLKCDQNATKPQFTFDEEKPAKTYKFTLTSRCNCPGLCRGSSGHKSKNDPGIVGIVLLLVLVIVIIVYFVVGMIIMRVKFGKTGTEIIPNKTFWTNLPFLVKDGVVFTFTPCMKCAGRDNRGYSTVKS